MGRRVGGSGTGTSRPQPHVARLPWEAKHLSEAKHLWKSSTFGSEGTAEAEEISGQGQALGTPCQDPLCPWDTVPGPFMPWGHCAKTFMPWGQCARTFMPCILLCFAP